MIYKIQPAKGANEVNTHYLEVLNARYQAEEFSKGGSAGGFEGTSKMEVDGFGGVKQEPAESQGLQGKAAVIFNAIRAVPDNRAETGVSKQELIKKFPSFSVAEIESILDKMSNEGQIYSTIDSDHYLSCC